MMIASTSIAMALKRKSRARMNAISIKTTRSIGKAIKIPMPALVISVHIIANEAPDPPISGRAIPSAMTHDPSQVPRSNVFARSSSNPVRGARSVLTPNGPAREFRGRTAASESPRQ